MLTHLTGRTLVLPDHLTADAQFATRPLSLSLWDFCDVEHLRQWIPIIAMSKYLDIRRGVDASKLTATFSITRNTSRT